MKPSHRLLPVALIAFAAAFLPRAQAAKPASDIQTPDQRRAVVERGERLANPPAAAPLPAELKPAFNPPGFERPDTPARPEARPSGDAKPAVSLAQASDRETLEAVADKIPTTGTIIIGGKPLLISGRNRIEVGSHFTVIYNGQEYELELVAIDRTTFTVRYKSEEFTRPIKLGKVP